MIEVSTEPPWMPCLSSAAGTGRAAGQGVGAGGDDEHVAAHAQVARHDVGDLRLAAVAVEQHELAHACAGDALADLGPQPDQRLGRKRERAGIGDVLVRLADGHRRQERHRQVGRQQLHRPRDHAAIDRRVDLDRQVRAVLLDGRHWQDGDHLRHVGRWKSLVVISTHRRRNRPGIWNLSAVAEASIASGLPLSSSSRDDSPRCYMGRRFIAFRSNGSDDRPRNGPRT